MTGRLLRQLIANVHSGGSAVWTSQQVETMFKSGFADAQNVPACILLMRGISSLGDRSVDNFPMYAGNKTAFDALLYARRLKSWHATSA
eukprot:5106930-Prymnesium_polylepis.1